MNPKFHYLVLLCFCSISSIVAYPDIYTQLCGINNEWYNIIPSGELLEKRQFSSEQELITYHLQQVEKHLTKKNINHLSKEIQQRRKEGLEVLRAYWKRGLYPKNNQFNFRIPFFIDDANTACAVGYIMQGTGYKDLANNIAETQNNAYVKEMVDDNILEWAVNYGFTADELAWIQPTYGPCNSIFTGVYFDKIVNPTCDKNDGSIIVNDWSIISYEWEHGANSLQLKNLSAGVYTVSGTFDGLEDVKCPFRLDVILENEESADLTINTLSNRSCPGIDDGMAEVIVNNANGNYNIEWSNGTTTAVVSNLSKSYNWVTVTDSMNCKAIGEAYIRMDRRLNSSETVSGTICNANTGSVSLLVEGDSSNGVYNFQWKDGSTSENRTDMEAGDYSVVISDNMGCFIEKDITIYDNCKGKINCKDDYVDINNQHGCNVFPFANDVDSMDGIITSFKVSQPSHGSINIPGYGHTSKKIAGNNAHVYYKGDGIYTGLDSLTYTVCTNYGFCDSATIYLNVVNRPVVSSYDTYADSMQIYLGETVTLRVQGAETYSWPSTESLRFSRHSDSYAWASPTETTTYTITGINADGQTDTYDITVEVLEANFEAFSNAIQVHKDFENNLIHIKGKLQMLDIRVLDAANNVVLNLSSESNTLTIDFSDSDNGLYYLDVQHKYFPNVNTTTVLKQ